MVFSRAYDLAIDAVKVMFKTQFENREIVHNRVLSGGLAVFSGIID